MKFPRIYDDLDSRLKPNKVLVLYGPRRVGKTTLLTNYLSQTQFKYQLDSGDNIKIQHLLSSQDFDQILPYVSQFQLYCVDEAQNVPNIGTSLKIIVDQVPGIRVIATGSSSFDLSGQVGEPLVGRQNTLTLFPLSQMELSKNYSPFELETKFLPDILIFGAYPLVLASPRPQKANILEDLVSSYLFKDILSLENVKNSKVLLDLLKLIAFQVGNEVSLTELGQQLNLDYKTVARYLDLFEKCFILINLRGFSRNLRTEVTKKSKYFFYDNGIRNAIISNFNPLDTRNDLGALWENFLISERLKYQKYKPLYANNYFWRTWDQKEIDFLEEREGKLFGYEFKYSISNTPPAPSLFNSTYPNSSYQVINPKNYLTFTS
ncbi:MAG: AAA ATPase [Microgenomates group bacterium Gr01-1014_16]|nr:MAG: AAA ATPase [Microgenomates group bacterium Gr01-1014_16]